MRQRRFEHLDGHLVRDGGERPGLAVPEVEGHGRLIGFDQMAVRTQMQLAVREGHAEQGVGREQGAARHVLLRRAAEAELTERGKGQEASSHDGTARDTAQFAEPNGVLALPAEVASEVGYDLLVADTMAGSLAIINIIAIVPLGGVAIKLLKNFNEQRSKGIDPVFHRDMLPDVPGVECWDGSDPVTRRSDADRRILRDRGEADRY